MKILDLDKFVNEGYTELRKTTTDILNLEKINIKCTWDGEHWYYYDREKKGSFDDFKKLAKNKNANFEVYFRYDFSLKGEHAKYDEEAKDECSVDQLVVVHFNNMEENDYDVNFKYCHNMDKLIDIIYDYDVDEDDEFLIKIRGMVSDDLNGTEDEIANEIEDRIGIKYNHDMVSSIIGEAINGFMENFE